jgi:GT2 family glycosyltransferase/glycosyltransferase involved in cell wall biosynthesis
MKKNKTNSHENENLKSYLALGNECMRRGDYNVAIELFSKALINTPDIRDIIQFNIDRAIIALNDSNKLIVKDTDECVGQKINLPSSVANLKPSAKLSPLYYGRLEKSDDGNVVGWAVNKNDPEDIFELTVTIDDCFYCLIKNDKPRGDLARLGRTTGKGGFQFSIPKELIVDSNSQVVIQFSNKDILSKFSINISAVTTDPDLVLIPTDENVSVIVPIYNALDDVIVCVERLLKYTSKDVDLILINDSSSDVKVGEYLNKLNVSNIRVFNNEVNLGFTKTVNRGIELAGRNDVILLNSDARVTPRWIEGFKRALKTDHKIATVTAMSDRAGAFSAPNIGNDNDLPPGITEEDYAIAFRRRGIGYYPTVPTGNGFCLYIRRSCLDEIGPLDSTAFPRGYGEENDFCMRARAAGWRNIIDDRTYVFHDRSKSFGEEKHDLMKAGRITVDSRYPDYAKSIKIFSQSQLINAARFRARIALNDCYKGIKPRVLYVISTVTGGTPQTNRDLMLALLDSNEPWLFRCDSKVMSLYKVNSTGDELVEQHFLREFVDPLNHKSPEYDRVITNWLMKYDFEVVHIRHLAWHSLSLPKLAKMAGARVIKSFHDLYTLCPTVKLVDDRGIFCGGKCTVSNGACQPQLWASDSFPTLKHKWVHNWRDNFSQALNYCDVFVTTSESVRQRNLEFLNLDSSIPFVVIPHGRDFSHFRSPSRNNIPVSKLKIVVPGNLDSTKGLSTIKSLLALDKDERLEIHLLGKSDQVINDKRVIDHGPYKRDEFVDHVTKIQPHIGVVFSIMDESWCHTLTEIWASGLPAVVFDFPTVATRIKKTGAGWIGSFDAPTLYNDLMSRYSDEEEYTHRIDAVETWQKTEGLFSNVRFMAIQYLNLYKSPAVVDVKQCIAVVCPSSRNQKTAPGSTHVRIWQNTYNSIDRKNTYLRLNPDELIAGIKLGFVNSAIIQRNVLSESAWNEIRPYVISKDFRYVFDIDDDLLNVPLSKDFDRTYFNYKDTLGEIIHYADTVIVSTQSLVSRFKNINENIVVLGNFLSKNCWLPQVSFAEGRDPFKAVYFGSYTHKVDLEMIIPALKMVHKKHPKFKLKIIGIAREGLPSEDWIEIVSIPDDAKDYVSFVKFLKLQTLDCSIGLAPLADDEFNSVKSDLKIKEYISLGLNVVCSDFGPYKSTDVAHSCIYRLENNVDAWFDFFDEKFSSNPFIAIDERERADFLIKNYNSMKYFDNCVLGAL